MANLAAIDCGTLSTRLLVSSPGGETIVRLTEITGLGQGVDRTRQLQPEAVARALAVLRRCREVMDGHGVGPVSMVGTSALRDATNRDMFSQPAAQIVGVPLQLLAGEEEAVLSFRGATAELAADGGPWLVADIGGGSTELVVGPEPFGACSLDLGCVRVTERFLAHDPPSAAELATARAWVDAELGRASSAIPALTSAGTLVGLAGTVSALARFDQGLVNYDRAAVHHYQLSARAVEAALGELSAQAASARAGRPGIVAARAPFIVGGALVLVTLMSHFGFEECLVSESDILDGLVLALAQASRGVGGAG